MHNFRKLTIWQNAMILAKEVYATTASFPKEEKYGLVSQINRCSVSVPSNISEGSSRSSNKEFAHFIKISIGSLFELETQLVLSNDFGIISNEKLNEFTPKIVSLQKMLSQFLKTLQ
ncbi:four helix bundle protein [Daejeonella sp.]|uniref:four helix bundle protein n=1 Tax=Daejeonella sp. TaxID=2805397 RepID=UPI0039837A47